MPHILSRLFFILDKTLIFQYRSVSLNALRLIIIVICTNLSLMSINTVHKNTNKNENGSYFFNLTKFVFGGHMVGPSDIYFEIDQ